MADVLIAVDPPRGEALAAEAAAAGVAVHATVGADAPAGGLPLPDDVRTLVLDVRRGTLSAALVAACDARGIRILPLCADESARRLAARFGLADPFPLDVDGWTLADAIAAPSPTAFPAPSPGSEGQVIAVWGPHGAPGRTTLAIELAAELSRGDTRVLLVDADTHAPAVAIALGIADEGPGFASACRHAQLGTLDETELARIAVPASTGGGSIDVLTGINRPGRWPELTDARVAAALAVARGSAAHVVVDVAASLERDEEIVSDLDGPRRNAATIAALQAADLVVAVCAADPVGIARFVRAHAELRATIGRTPVVVVVNRLRAATMGLDARGQVRRSLERFAGIQDVWFVPLDPRSADAAMLAARSVAELSPRSPLATAVRRLVGEAVAPVRPAALTRRRARRSA